MTEPEKHEKNFKPRIHLSDIDLRLKSIEELEALRDELEEAIAGIKLQLANAKAKVATSGEYSDPGWYNAAQFALRMKGRDHQRLLREIGLRNKTKRITISNSDQQRFIDVARRRLDPELFADLWREAREEDSRA